MYSYEPGRGAVEKRRMLGRMRGYARRAAHARLTGDIRLARFMDEQIDKVYHEAKLNGWSEGAFVRAEERGREMGYGRHERGLPIRDPGKRHHAPAVRIPKRKRAAVSRKIRRLIKEGYSPRYAAKEAYHPGRDVPGALRRTADRYERAREKARHAHARIKHGYARARAGYHRVKERAHRAHETVKRTHRRLKAAHHAYRTTHDPRLTAAERRRLGASQFALPERRALPIENRAHIRNAAARLEQMHRRGTVTEREYHEAHRRILAAERRHKIGAFRKRRHLSRRRRT